MAFLLARVYASVGGAVTVLVVVAHPDDEVLGCGGAIARLADEGEEVQVVILAGDDTSRQPRADAERAVAHLGAAFGAQWHLPDQRFDTVPFVEIVGFVEVMIERDRVGTIYTHHPGDLNLDHRIAHRAVMTACRPAGPFPVKVIYAMEIASSTEWGDGSFHPNTYVDITGTPLLRKVEAMEMYETERRPWPHPRSPKAIRSLAQLRGSHVGLEAAEAFQLIRQIL